MHLTRENLYQYLLWAGLSVGLGFLIALASELPGDNPINWRAVALATVSALAGVLTTVIRSMTLPKVGQEAVAAQSKHLEQSGIPVTEQVVVQTSEDQTEKLTEHAVAANKGEETLTVQHTPGFVTPSAPPIHFRSPSPSES